MININDFKSLNYQEIKNNAEKLSQVKDYIPLLFRTREYGEFRVQFLKENLEFKNELLEIKKKKRNEFKKAKDKKEHLLKQCIDFINKYPEYTLLINLKKK